MCVCIIVCVIECFRVTACVRVIVCVCESLDEYIDWGTVLFTEYMALLTEIVG